MQVAERVYKVTLTGNTAILFHHDNIEACDELTDWRKDHKNKNQSKAGDDRSPGWTWQTYLYDDGENVAMPSDNVMACVRKASAGVVLKKQTTFKQLSQSGMCFDTEYLEFRYGMPKQNWRTLSSDELNGIRNLSFAEQAEAAKRLGFRLFVKRARVGQSKHIRVRPRFDRWQVVGNLTVRAEEITADVLQKIFDIAGSVGLGDWRPGCSTPGPYGTFTATVE